MTLEQKRAIKAVEKINNKIFKKYDKDNIVDIMPIISINICDMMFTISIFIPYDFGNYEIEIYNSEHNDRIFCEETNSYESYYDLIKRKFKDAKKDICKIKL